MKADEVVENMVRTLSHHPPAFVRDLVDREPRIVEYVQYNYCVGHETAVEIVRRVSELARGEKPR